jgi:hypothetical protein
MIFKVFAVSCSRMPVTPTYDGHTDCTTAPEVSSTKIERKRERERAEYIFLSLP